MTNSQKNIKMTDILERSSCPVPPRLQKLLLPLLLALLLGGLAFAMTGRNAAPAVSFTTISGGRLELEQMRGKVVLVNFWTTSCSGCIAEMPQMMSAYRDYHAKGFELVTVAMSYDPPSHVANYAKQHALPFPVAFDPKGELAQAFDNVQLTPTAFVIDKQGKIIRHVVGELDFPALRALLDKEL
jgi:peroxiredoxin